MDSEVAEEALIGGGVPVGSGRGEVARELRGSEAERLVRSIEGGEGRRRGFDGEVKLVEVRAEGRRCSAAWERVKGERARGTGRWGICSAAARERRERRALSWPGHGDGEVAAGGHSGRVARQRER